MLTAALLLTLFAYVDRLYTEMGKFFLRGVHDNIEHFERDVEPKLGADRARAGLTYALLTQLMILILAVYATWITFRNPNITWQQPVETLALLLFAVLVFAHLVPHVLITRTSGAWLRPFAPLLQMASWVALPAVLVLSFSFTVSDLAKPEETKHAPTPEQESAALEALMDKGEEHGVLEEEDRKLIQSVVEFGDKVVREVMTPRPKIVAVERNATLDDLLRALADQNFSRVPVYEGSLDNIIGVVSTRDLIQMTDQELKQTRAWERVRDVPMVPETKPVTDLLRELQKSNQRMAIVVDEYGGVSGLATIEDMVEEIVGEIGEEGEKPEAAAQPDGSWTISGQAGLDVLEREFGWTLPEGGDFTTVAGLVNALAGHVPRPGEAVSSDGLRFEVLASTDTLVSRVRVTKSHEKVSQDEPPQ